MGTWRTFTDDSVIGTDSHLPWTHGAGGSLVAGVLTGGWAGTGAEEEACRVQGGGGALGRGRSSRRAHGLFAGAMQGQTCFLSLHEGLGPGGP